MKVTCKNCRKVVQPPDEWAGRKVKCPGCKQPIRIPNPDAERAEKDLGLNLASLEAIEAGGQALERDEESMPMTLAEAKAAREAQSGKKAVFDPAMRTCPSCFTKVRVEDLYAEVMCSNCGGGIPPTNHKKVAGGGFKAADTGDKFLTSFYGGFTTAAMYPLPAITSIFVAMAIALGTVAIPVSAMVALQSASASNEVAKEQPDVGWVGYFITVMFVIQAIYLGSVAYYVLIDTIRTTTTGSDQPTSLTWSPVKLVSALGGYGALLGFYGVIASILILIAGGSIPPGAEDIKLLGKPLSLIVLALITFGVPMNMIGLASAESVDGLNPKKVAMSVIHVAGHYTFLFLIFLIYLSINVAIMYGVMSLAGPKIMQAAREGIGKGYMNMLIGLGGWACVIGSGFYFAYSVGRVLGLFARSFKEDLDFEL